MHLVMPSESRDQRVLSVDVSQPFPSFGTDQPCVFRLRSDMNGEICWRETSSRAADERTAPFIGFLLDRPDVKVYGQVRFHMLNTLELQLVRDHFPRDTV